MGDCRVDAVPSPSAAGPRVTGDDAPDVVVAFARPDDPAVAELCRQARSDPATLGPAVVVASKGPVSDEQRRALVAAGAEVVLDEGEPASFETVVIALVRCLRRRSDALRRQRALQTVLRKRTSDLWAMEERYRLLVENSPDAIVVVGSDGTILEANPAATALTGHRRDTLLGRTLLELTPPDRTAELRQDLKQWFQGDRSGRDRWLYGAEGRAIEVEIRASRIGAEGQMAAILHIRDLTDRRRAEEELNASRERLAELQKMETIGRLSAGIAHDFNNMLTAILGYGQLLEHDPGIPETARNDIAEMMQAARRAETLVRQLQTFGRSSEGERVPMDVNEVVRDMDRLLRRTMGKDIELVTLLDEQPCIIVGDPGRLSQAVMNLAIRARDVLPPHGRLQLSTDVVVVNAEFVRTRPGLPEGALVRLQVEDNGPTPTQEDLAHAFEPFYRRPGEKGTGMALAVVRSIALAFGGGCEVAARPEGGTVFTLYFPYQPDTVPIAAPDRSATVRGGTETILVVDDERGVLNLAGRMLKAGGYEVVEASNGIEALHAFEREPSRFDLVLTDIIMPGLSGPELIDRMLKLRPELRAMCMTGYAHEPFATVSERARVPVISKPFTRAGLLFAVRQALDGGPDVVES